MKKSFLSLLFFLLCLLGFSQIYGLIGNNNAILETKNGYYSLPIDTESAKYFPLNVGNTYTYYWNDVSLPPSSGYYKAKITKDTLISNKRYYYCQNFPWIGTGWVRYDSETSNLLLRAVGQGCSVYTDDKILDSLNSKIGNQITCQIGVFYTRACSDTNNYTIFGQSIKSKYFHDDGLMLGNTRYGCNFGIVYFDTGEPYITTSTTLKGCVINSILYGDTSITFTISGTVKYNDNNQPVTSGTIKAFKFDKNTNNILIFDTAVIQSDGSYTLSHVPQDSVDIGVFPNSIPPVDWVITYYPSTIYWQSATVLYPTGNLTNINVSAIRMTTTVNSNSVNGKVMRLTDLTVGNLKDAVLYVKNGNTFVRYAVTDTNGVYHLQSLPSGNLKIIVTHSGFYPDSTNVNVTTTSSIDSVNFYLNRYSVVVKQISNTVPSDYKLFQNYPNPFNPTTNIKYNVKSSKLIKLVVYNVLGKEVATLVNEKQSAGVYQVTFDGNNLSSGIYFYKLEVGTSDKKAINYVETKSMVLIK
jgi:hypothetical protein